MALKSGYIPPCVGLKTREFDLNLVLQTRQINPNYALCLSFGFGGQNAVLAVGS